MAEATLGKAYVQILPSANGIKGQLTKVLGGETEQAGDSLGRRLGSRIKNALVTAGIGAAVGGVIKSAISEGSKLEQSIGGIETLFKSSAGKVEQYAKDAFRTAGLSANEYMEQATSFAAGLVASCGGDTAKAAEVANTALIDMSDNANKMGSNMEDLQNAYQGFAKQNYTMLDNLKLGYGGTKQEMERLLADAQKLTGVKYDINNLSDVYEAIHEIQKNLDITGTTAKESSTTFSGSFNQMKAAAQNLLGYMATGMDIGPAIQQLAESTSTFLFQNALPMLGKVIVQIPSVVLQMIRTAIPIIREQAPKLIRELIQSLKENIPEIIKLGRELITEFGKGMAEEFPQLSLVFNNLLPITDGLSMAFGAFKTVNFATNLVDQGKNLMGTFTGLLGKAQGFGGAFGALKGVISAAGPWGIAAGAVLGLGAAFVSLYNNNEDFRNFVNATWQGICDFCVETWNNLAKAASDCWNGIVEGWTNAWNGIKDFFSGLWQGICDVFNFGVELVRSIVEGAVQLWTLPWQFIWNNWGTDITNFWNGMTAFLSECWNNIVAVMHQVFDPITEFFANFWQDICDTTTGTWNTLTESLSQLWARLVELAQQTWQNIVDTMHRILDPIVEAITNIWNSVKSKTTEIWNGMTSFLSGCWTGIKNTAAKAWNTIKDVCLKPIEGLKNTIKGIIDKIKGFFANCNIQFPKIKLPHFSIKGHFSLTPPSVPKLGIDWYAKAMRGGMILDNPTIFGSMNGKLLGAGEAGKEAVVGVNSLHQMIRSAVHSAAGPSADSPEIDYQRIGQAVRQALATMKIENVVIVGDRILQREISRVSVDQDNALAIAKGA
ncbi:phage tail protein [Faecalibaculum rodentium]|uniref:phage tail protein n=1 Tax=Faecalibaculum rodentium TaxID=1702221 RepID=UPI0025B767C6|nr:hypothetical protein [Faecalibaculum rodentium]